jgi:Uma2 family endonuclease
MEPYDELIEGVGVSRSEPRGRHEQVCERLHAAVSAALNGITTTRLLPPRALVELAPDNHFRPDLTLITVATGRVWLAAEIISTDDHRWDTVTKKQLYEAMNIPRLWMIDPRYDNVEVYHGGQYGLALKGMFAGRELLTEKLLPALQVRVEELFGVAPQRG